MANLADLLARNDSLKNRQEAREQAWRQQLYAMHPVIEQLEARKRTLLVDQLQEILRKPSQKDAIKARVAEQVQEIEVQLMDYKQQHGIREYVRDEICPLCGGSGYVQGVLCTCIREQAYVEVLGGQDFLVMPGSFAEYNDAIFGNNDVQRQRTRGIRLFLQDYAKKYPHSDKKQMLMTGQAGLGKSFLLHALLKELYQKEQDICCISAGRLFDYFHQHRLGEGYAIDLIYEAKILAIDDLGSEPMTANVTREYFFELLCRRAENGLYTIMVTNHSDLALKERYTERTYSRMVSVKDSHVLRFEGDDLRLSLT